MPQELFAEPGNPRPPSQPASHTQITIRFLRLLSVADAYRSLYFVRVGGSAESPQSAKMTALRAELGLLKQGALNKRAR